MPDIGLLLREAVPPDAGEPDLEAVVRRVAQRRQRRRLLRTSAAGGLAALLLVGLVALGHDRPDGDDVSTDVTTTGPEELPDATEFVHRMGTRGALATTDLGGWPLDPADFVGGSARSHGGVLVGTLEEVRSGQAGPWPCFADGGTDTCLLLLHMETLIRVEQVLPGGTVPDEPVAVPWMVETVSHDPRLEADAQAQVVAEQTRAATAPFREVAPVGARVIVFLARVRPSSEEPLPVEPSGIVVEGADGRAYVPHPDPAQSRRPQTFDEYLAEVEELLGS